MRIEQYLENTPKHYFNTIWGTTTSYPPQVSQGQEWSGRNKESSHRQRIYFPLVFPLLNTKTTKFDPTILRDNFKILKNKIRIVTATLESFLVQVFLKHLFSYY